ncbi:MAG: hypothetical protein ACRC7O_10755, partial [Fimbriiglobus sp.]
CVVFTPFQMMFPSRLVFGKKVFQIVEKTLSGDAVTLQVPYRNIAAVPCEKDGDGEWNAFIVIHDPADPDTFGGFCGRQGPGPEGATYKLPTGWEISIKDVARRIEKQCGEVV